MNILFPVILPVPIEKQQLKGREKVLFLSQYARLAVERSAENNNVSIDNLKKGENGVPLPSYGYNWSISHKPEYVAGVVSKKPIGIDLEKFRPYSIGLEKKVADDDEWALYQIERSELLFRYWTAKEAVLKTAGIGLAGLSSCKIKKAIDSDHMIVFFNNRNYLVEHVSFNGHVAAIVTDHNTHIEWIFDD